MARSPWQRGGILDYLPDPLQQPQPFQQPALGQNAASQQVASGLNTATRSDPASPWGTLQDAWQSAVGGTAPGWQVGSTAAPDWDSSQMMFAKAASEPTQTALPSGPPPPPAPPPSTAPAQEAEAAARERDMRANPQATANPGPRGDGSLFLTPDVEGSFGSTWDGTRWISNPNGTPAGSPVGKSGAILPVAYNASADTFRHEYNGQAAEQSRTRVARWAADNQRMFGMGAQDAYNAALARLKRDMGPNWQQSGFDLSGIQAAPLGNDRYVPQVAAPGQAAAPPPPGTAAPAPGTPAPGAGAPAPGPAGTTPATVGGGQNAVNMAIAGDESQQLRILMQSIGINPDSKGIFGRTIQNTLKSILPAYMSLQGFGMAPGQGQNPGDMLEQNIRGLGQIFNGTGGFNAALQQAAAQAKAQLGSGTWASKNLDEAGTLQALGNITNLATRGMNPLMQNAYKDWYDEAIGNERDAQLASIRTGKGELPSAADWLRNSQWADLLR